MKLNDILKKYHKFLGVAVIIILLFPVGYKEFCPSGCENLKYADRLIKLKANSYLPFRQGGELIKANSQKGDKIIATGEPMVVYYSEREVIIFPSKEEEFLDYIQKEKPKYVILSPEGFPEWVPLWFQNNPDKGRPVQVYYMDAEKTQPYLVIYQLIYE